MELTSQAEKAPLLRDLPSRLLAQTAALVSRVAGECLAAEGTHRHHFAALATLEAFGAASQAELCRRTDIDRSDMNAVMNALEAEGAITRRTDPENRRQYIVDLTGPGRKRFEHLKERILEAQDQALAPLSGAERQELVRLLRIVHDHLAPAVAGES